MTEPVQVPLGNERIIAAVRAPIPHIYANGFVNSLGNADIVISFEANGEPVATLNISYTMAKTMHVALGHLIATLETVTSKEMLTTHEIDAALAKHFGSDQP